MGSKIAPRRIDDTRGARPRDRLAVDLAANDAAIRDLLKNLGG
jgi:hypothetical protein